MDADFHLRLALRSSSTSVAFEYGVSWTMSGAVEKRQKKYMWWREEEKIVYEMVEELAREL